MHPEDEETTNDKVDTPIGSDLTDYNFIDENGNPLPLDPNGNPIQHTGDNEQSTKRSPLGSRMALQSDEDMDGNAEQQLSAHESLTDRLHFNGSKMRQIINRDPVQSRRAISMKAATRSLEEMLEEIPLEDAEQVSTFQGQVYMPESFLEKYLLPTMQLRKCLENEAAPSESDQTLPGGIETAMMHSMFNQTKVVGDAESNRKLRALIAHAEEQTPQLVDQIGQNIRSKTRSLEIY